MINKLSVFSIPLRIFFPAIFITASLVLSITSAIIAPGEADRQIENSKIQHVRKIMYTLQTLGEHKGKLDFAQIFAAVIPEDHVDLLVLVDKNSNIVNAHEARHIGKSLADLFQRDFPYADLAESLIKNSRRLNRGFIELVSQKQKILVVHPVNLPVDTLVDIRPKVDLSIVMVYDLAYLKQVERENILYMITVTTSALFLFSILVTLIFSRSLSSRLMKVLTATEKFGTGDLKARVNVQGRDEIATLGKAFNKMAERIQTLAMTDHLTGIYNRRSFEIEAESKLSRYTENQHKVCAPVLFYIDFDDFKEINDSLGHSAGDILLREFTARIHLVLPPDAVFGRIGGDEFLILHSALATRIEIEDLCRSIISEGARPYLLGGGSYSITVSIGIAIADPVQVDLTRLLKNCDVALQAAKQKGKNRFEYCTRELIRFYSRKQHLLGLLKEATENDGFTLFYQTIQGASDSAIRGVEALLRWKHADFPGITPDEFIPVLMETGMIRQVGSWVLNRALQDYKTMRQKLSGAIEDFTVSVNVSAQEIILPDFAANVLETLKRYEVPSRALILEFTEAELLKDTEATRRALDRLRKEGVRIAIDDFGTGYSSLSYLKTLPVDHLKIDKSFIIEIDRDKKLQAIARSVVSLASALGLQVVAEGVENEATVKFLHNLKIQFLQGFYFARPAPLDDVLALIEHSRVTAP